MFLLTLKDRKDDGAYAVQDQYGHKVLFLFEEEDDADRYLTMLEYDEDYPPMKVTSIDEDVIIKACNDRDQQYSIITSDDFIIPPKPLP